MDESIEMLNKLEKPDSTVEDYDKALTFIRGGTYNEQNPKYRITLLITITIIETRKRILKLKKENKIVQDSQKADINNILGRLSSLEEKFEKTKKYMDKTGQE